MFNLAVSSLLLAAAAAALFNWTQTESDALWFYINFLIIAACALGAPALWRNAHAAARWTGGLLAALAATVALQAAVIEPLLRPAALIIWEVVNFTLVIALPFAAGLLRRRS
ncbi:MAG: hypothetical protein OXU88_05995 [Gammaproteobacteria bacterium]|nr:hypothetical protein [Gammaproteobacteria bacterium]